MQHVQPNLWSSTYFGDSLTSFNIFYDGINTYIKFFIYCVFPVLIWQYYFISIRYELDCLPAYTNQTNFIFLHNKFSLCARFFPLINGLLIYDGNLTFTVYPSHFPLNFFQLNCCTRVYS